MPCAPASSESLVAPTAAAGASAETSLAGGTDIDADRGTGAATTAPISPDQAASLAAALSLAATLMRLGKHSRAYVFTLSPLREALLHDRVRDCSSMIACATTR